MRISTPGGSGAPLRLVAAATDAPLRGHLRMGEPVGTPDRIEVTSRYLTRGGRPFIPVMGELHYARVPASEWAEELAAMKAGGITVVATYVFWILHEEHRGQFRWDGDRDLRRFVELCACAGLDVVVRIGPWGHGEARHGGFPDWLDEAAGPTARTDDPRYLDLVHPYLAQVAAQVDGLFHSQGGPIIGVQVENELDDQPGHLRTLRRIAEGLGMTPALWTATAWGGAHLPTDDVIPLYAGYADAFWEDWDTGWPSNASLHFRYDTPRDDLSVGADVRAVADADVDTDRMSGAPGTDGVPDDLRNPYATCELGGGMHVAYHRRPLVDPADVAALALTKLGSGSVWQGFYMFHGGSQVRIGNGFTQESHATGYPNDVPQVSYDFRAPLGEFGQVRAHFHTLRGQHLFLEAVGSTLATMTTTLPIPVPSDAGEPEALRWAVRSAGETGFLFVTNHQPAAAPLPERTDVRFAITLGTDTVTLPSVPITVPSGAVFIWPLNLRLTSTTVLRYATGQLLTRVEPVAAGDPPLVVLVAQDGIAVELVVAGAERIDGPVEVHAEADGTRRLTLTTTPGPEAVIRLAGAAPVDLIVLDAEQAARAWVVPLGGARRLVLTEADVLPQPAGALLRTGAGEVVLDVWPREGLGELRATEPGWSVDVAGPAASRFARVQVGTTPLEAMVATVELRAEADPGALAPLRLGPLDRASAPTGEELRGAARYTVTLDQVPFEQLSRLYLEVDWAGDIAQLHVDGQLVADQFYAGDPLSVDLLRWRDALVGGRLELRILPWRRGAPIFLDPRARLSDGDPVAAVREVRLRPVRTVTLTLDRPAR